MPKYRVTVDGHDYLVEVPDPTERPVRAIVDGYTLEVAVASEALGSPVPAAPSQEAVAPVVMTRPAVPSVGSATSSGGGGEVKAPLPGTIVGVSVVVGDAVTHGQELCVLEAMKMNNPIRAMQSGIVREIRVSIGQQVQHGAILMVVAEA